MTRKLKILIVEDEAAIRNGLIDVFVYHGFEVDEAADGRVGLKKALSGTFDLILLDIMLPEVNGYEICEQIRRADRDQPVIMLTARSGDDDIIRGLSLGADDYVAKPFSVAELVLRVQAVLRRSQAGADQERTIKLSGDVEIDTRNLNGRRGDESLEFTRREMEVIEYLRANHDRPVSREELLARVWGYGRDLDIETRTVDIHIAKIRRKIEPEPGDPVNLVTIRGAGYRLMVPQ